MAIGGQPGTFIGPVSQTLGGATGRTYTLGNTVAAILKNVAVKVVTTATAGNRTMQFNLKDVGGNILFISSPPATIPASSTFWINWGAGCPASSLLFNGWTVPIPAEMIILPAATFTIFDVLNTDPNDVITATAVFAM